VALPPPAPDSTCLVTGASSGIGADIARQLADRGHGVTLVARREEKLRELADEIISRTGVRVEVVTCDVSDETSRDLMIAEVEKRGLIVEVLVNNAGFGTAGPFTEIDKEREVELVRTNIEAVVAFCGEYAPQMAARERGAILNTASTAAFQPLPIQATYAASKAFVLSFSEALHEELGAHGISVTALCPGPVATEFVEVAGMTDDASGLPKFMWSTAEDVARAGVKGLEKGKRVVVPGALNRAGAVGGAHMPRALLLPLTRRAHPSGR
jgi:short-subunit dehydrogenase